MMMKRFALLGLMLMAGIAKAQLIVPEKKFNELFKNHQYDEVLDEATRLRDEVYGKNALLDYYIAKSFCLKNQQDEAARMYNQIRKNYNLSTKQIKFLQSELSNCNQPEGQQTPVLLSASNSNYLNNVQLPVAGVEGKMGMVFNCYTRVLLSHFDSLVTREEFESRLFRLDEKKKAYEKLTAMTGEEYAVDSAGRFMLVTLREYSLNSKEVRQTMEQLEKTFQFYIRFYHLRFPDKLLTVYLMPDNKQLNKFAQKIHHLDFPSNQLGYSCAADLSLVGIADPSQLATLFHELFHIVVRTDIGDIPAWLDEGLASLYTISHWEGDQLVGNFRPWRWEELHKAAGAGDFAMQVPTLRKLAGYDWHEFNGIEDSIFNLCRAATNYAYANFLMIYLQQNNQLPTLLDAFKNRQKSGSASVTGSDDNAFILETALGIDIDSLNTKYDRWLSVKENINIRRDHSWQNIVFENFAQKMERCEVGLEMMRYSTRNSRASSDLQKRFDSLRKDYNLNMELYRGQETEIRGRVENVSSTLLPLPYDHTMPLSRAIIFYNEIARLEMDMRKLLFSEKRN